MLKIIIITGFCNIEINKLSKELTLKHNNSSHFMYPENGLHPIHQSGMIDKLLENNKTNIIETHSSEIFNKIRVLVKQNKLNLSEVDVYFINKEKERIKIDFNEYGRISNTPFPVGFFDFNEMCLDILIDLHKGELYELYE